MNLAEFHEREVHLSRIFRPGDDDADDQEGRVPRISDGAVVHRVDVPGADIDVVHLDGELLVVHPADLEGLPVESLRRLLAQLDAELFFLEGVDVSIDPDGELAGHGRSLVPSLPRRALAVFTQRRPSGTRAVGGRC